MEIKSRPDKNQPGETVSLNENFPKTTAFRQRIEPLQEENKWLQKKVDELTDRLAKAKNDVKKKTARLRRSQKALCTSGLLLKNTMQTLENALFIIDAKTTKIIDCSPSAEKIFGYHRNEMLNNTVDFLHVDAFSLKEFRNHLYPAITKKGFFHMHNFKMKRKDGNEFHSSHTVIPVKNKHDKVMQWVSLVRDDTKGKFLKNTLAENVNRYQLLVETMREGIAIQDENGKITYVNNKVLDMIGYSREELIGQSPFTFLDKANQNILKKQQQKRNRGERSSYELTWTRKDGQKQHTIVSPRAVYTKTGAFKGTFSVITDITELKQTMVKLQKKEKELLEKSANLEDNNAALRGLLNQRNIDRKENEEKILLNVKELVEPYVELLRKTKLTERQHNLLKIIRSNIDELTSNFTYKLNTNFIKLTPTELKVANFIKHGKTNKEIADQMCLSIRTIEFHRENIRKKIGIKNKKINLRMRLMSYD